MNLDRTELSSSEVVRISFYDRQFLTREFENHGSLEKFDNLLNDYFSSDKPQKLGTPSVGYFADHLHLSSNYFGDLIKKETGKSAQEYIQNKLIEVAKERVLDPNKSVSEIAYELGFKYPQHFTRLFKQHVGHSPSEFRNLNLVSTSFDVYKNQMDSFRKGLEITITTYAYSNKDVKGNLTFIDPVLDP